MQTCFFYLSGIMPPEEAVAAIKGAITKTYGKRGDKVVEMNYNAVDQAIANLHEIDYPAVPTSTTHKPPLVPEEAPDFLKKVTAPIMAGLGHTLPVSALPDDGIWPTDTTRWEKRNIALEIPVWEPALCIQCGKCSLHCPHATIRTKLYDPRPASRRSADLQVRDARRAKRTRARPGRCRWPPRTAPGAGSAWRSARGKTRPTPRRKPSAWPSSPRCGVPERENYSFFLSLPDPDRTQVRVGTVKGSQLLRPLFEYSGACAGCGETPYVKLLTQLVGDRLLIGNATGCSSIYGGNLPTTPYAKNDEGRGPAWNNSLFEDAAEFSYGLRLTVDKQTEFARELVERSSKTPWGRSWWKRFLPPVRRTRRRSPGSASGSPNSRAGCEARIADNGSDPRYAQLLSVADYLVRKSVWGIGGDGWAFDIGYGGLDHVLASQRNINLLVLNTQMYSNTGGQCSKATPMGSVALFAAGGKTIGKKDLGSIAMTYGNIYVAQVALGYSDAQTVRAFVEAESLRRPLAHHRLQPLHQHGFRPQKGLRASEGRGAVGIVVRLPVRPAARGAGQEPPADRLPRPDSPS